MKSLKRVWDRSLPPPVAEAGRRSVGNRKERLRDYASSPDRQPNVTHARSAQERTKLGIQSNFFARRLLQSRMRRSSHLPVESEFSPYSPKAQRSAQPVGIPTDILSKCIRIVIVAFGFSPILAYGRFAHGLRWGFHPHAPDKGFHPLTLLRFAPIFVTAHSLPFAYQSRISVPACIACSLSPIRSLRKAKAASPVQCPV